MVNEPEFGHPFFNEAAKALRGMGHEVFNPADQDRVNGFNFDGAEGTMQELLDAGFDRRLFLGQDMAWIAEHSDGMVALPNWRESAGTKAEIAFHHALGLPVWGLQDFLNDGKTAQQIRPATDPPPSARTDILDEAKHLISRVRNNVYGAPTQDFQRSADALNAYGYMGPGGRKMLPHDIAVIIMSVKLSRIVWSPDHRDNWVDMAGYAGCGWECVVEENFD